MCGRFYAKVGCCCAPGGVSLGSVLLGPLLWHRSNNDVKRSLAESVARQWPISNNGVAFSLGSVLRVRCSGIIILGLRC
jgi:hypothetical protein